MLGLQNNHEIKPELELFYEFAESEEDMKAGRTAPIQNTFDDIRSKLLKMKIESRECV